MEKSIIELKDELRNTAICPDILVDRREVTMAFDGQAYTGRISKVTQRHTPSGPELDIEIIELKRAKP